MLKDLSKKFIHRYKSDIYCKKEYLKTMTKIIKAIPNECVITLSFFKLEMEEMIEDAKKLRNITSFNLAQEIMSFLKDKKMKEKE